MVVTKRGLKYGRVSTELQAGDDKVSLDEQSHDMDTFCQQQSIEIVGEFSDVASGTSKSRPGFLRMLERAKEDDIDVIVCWKSDRLVRDIHTAAALLEVTEPRDIDIVSVHGDVDKKFMSLMAAISGIELDNMSERFKMGMRGRARTGLIPTGRICYGYFIDDSKKAQINERGANVVRLIYRCGTEYNMTARQITDWLNEQGIPPPPNSSRSDWSKSAILRILRNPAYKGEWQYGKTRNTTDSSGKRISKPTSPENQIRVAIPKIIDSDTWQAAQEAIDKRTFQSPRNTKEFYLLRRMLYCSECGLLFACRTSWSRTVYRNGERYSYEYDPPLKAYHCNGMLSHKTECRSPSAIDARMMDALIVQELGVILADPDTLFAGIEAAQLDRETRTKLEMEIADAEEHVKAQKNSIRRLIRLHAGGKISEEEFDEIVSPIRERESQFERLRADLRSQERAGVVEEEDKDRIRYWATEVRQRLDTLTDDQRRELVTEVFAGIVVNGNDEVTLTISLPGSNFVSFEEQSPTCQHLKRDKKVLYTWRVQLPPPPPPPMREIPKGAKYHVAIGHSLGNAIRLRRHELKLLQRDVRARVGVCATTFSRWENGRSTPRASYLRKLVECLDLDVATAVEDHYSTLTTSHVGLPLGAAIRHRRDNTGLSQQALADRVDVSTCCVRRWESGEVAPTLPQLTSLSDCLGLNVTDMIPQHDGIPDTLGNRLRQRRLLENVTGVETAQRLGIAHGGYSGWETGGRFPHPAYWPLLSEWLGVDIAMFVLEEVSLPTIADIRQDRSVAELIRTRRESLSMTREALATLTGAAPGTVACWECSREWPSPRFHKALSKALEIDVAQVINDVRMGMINDVIPGTLGDYIRLRLFVLGLSHTKLTAILGCRDRQIRGWELGLQAPSLQFHFGLTEFLGLDVDSLPAKAKLRQVAGPSPSLGDIVRETRLNEGLTSIALSYKLGIDDATIRKIESGDRLPRHWDNIEKIIEWLGIDIRPLLR